MACGLLAALLAACLLAPPASAAPGRVPPSAALARGPFVPGEAIVRFEAGASRAERRDARAAAAVRFDESLILPRGELVEVEGPVGAAVRRLERQPDVAYAQPNFRYRTTAVEAPDDTFFGQLWGLSDPALPNPGVSALEAWEVTEGAGQTIAVVDSGVDLTHPDLAANLWTNPVEALLPTDGLDNDLNGRVDDVHGYDFVDGDGDPDDYEFHGTHVAGTAAAVADNGMGVAGVAPAAEIMAVRVLDGNGSGSTAGIADGIAYAAENGADVVNLSILGPPGVDAAMSDAVDVAAAEDVVVVAAAGNEAANNDAAPHSPCALPQPNLVCTAALAQSGALASFSNYGPEHVDLAAPGTSILSARTDYGPPLFSNGFEAGETAAWETAAFNGGIPWGLSSKAATGAQSAADSPVGTYGPALDPEDLSVSELSTVDPVDLAGERGCRLHFRDMYQTQPLVDAFLAGAIDEGTEFEVMSVSGSSAGYPKDFSREETSISRLDGQSDVHPFFAVLADASDQRDGAYVDDVRLICRDETYVNAIASGAEADLPNAGNYVHFQGTSMAAPHVSGVVALVRAAAPGLSAPEAIDAVLEGTSAIPVPDPSRRTATEGIADACQAIAVATGAGVVSECPGSSENVPPPAPEPPAGDSAPAAFATPSPSPVPTPPAGDTRRPLTSFERRPPRLVRARGRRARVVFRFGSDEAGTGFFCQIDGAPYRRCRARLVRRFGLGAHVLRVIAVDAAGNADRTPAVTRFRVVRRP
jgi:thermitase